jgi:hypothetical protein
MYAFTSGIGVIDGLLYARNSEICGREALGVVNGYRKKFIKYYS